MFITYNASLCLSVATHTYLGLLRLQLTLAARQRNLLAVALLLLQQRVHQLGNDQLLRAHALLRGETLVAQRLGDQRRSNT